MEINFTKISYEDLSHFHGSFKSSVHYACVKACEFCGESNAGLNWCLINVSASCVLLFDKQTFGTMS